MSSAKTTVCSSVSARGVTRDVLRHDLDAVGRGQRLVGQRVAESLGNDVVERRDLDGAVDEHRARLAHDLLDFVGGEAALLVERRRLDAGSRRS